MANLPQAGNDPSREFLLLKEIEEKRAEKRQATSTGGASPQLVQNFAQAGKGASRAKAAKKVGWSHTTAEKAAGHGLLTQNEAARIKAMAERRVGRLVSEMQEAGTLAKRGGDRVREQTDSVLVCSEIGLTRNKSSRYQREAQLSDEDLDDLVAECNEVGKELTQALIIKRATGAHVGQNAGENEWYTPKEYIADGAAMTNQALPANLPEAQKGDSRGSNPQPRENFPQADKGRARAKASKQVGWSPRTAEKAAAVTKRIEEAESAGQRRR